MVFKSVKPNQDMRALFQNETRPRMVYAAAGMHICLPSLSSKMAVRKTTFVVLGAREKTTKARESREDERVSVPCLYFLLYSLRKNSMTFDEHNEQRNVL